MRDGRKWYLAESAKGTESFTSEPESLDLTEVLERLEFGSMVV